MKAHPYGAAAKRATANPRSLLSQISAIVPPARANGPEPKKPQRKRETSSVPIFFASAQGMLKTGRSHVMSDSVMGSAYNDKDTYGCRRETALPRTAVARATRSVHARQSD